MLDEKKVLDEKVSAGEGLSLSVLRLGAVSDVWS